MKKTLMTLLAAVATLTAATGVRADYIDWASSLGPMGIVRGDTTIGNFPGFYGGEFPGAFPIPLTGAQAIAAVLGAPDNSFLSLPGNEAGAPTPSGTGFKWAFVDVAFAGGGFDASSDLYIKELGNNSESVYLFVWTADGSNVQLVRTRGIDDMIVVDLAPYSGFSAAHGGFTHVTLGGQDLLGASFGFDLDAVGVSRVPEPGTLTLLGLGLSGLALSRRRRQGASGQSPARSPSTHHA